MPPNAEIPAEFRPSPLPRPQRSTRRVRRYQKPRAPPSSPVTPPFNMNAWLLAQNLNELGVTPPGELSPLVAPVRPAVVPPRPPRPFISNFPMIPQYESAAYQLLRYLGELYGPKQGIAAISPEQQHTIASRVKDFLNMGGSKYLFTSMSQVNPKGEAVGIPGMEGVSIQEFLQGLTFSHPYAQEMFNRVRANIAKASRLSGRGGRRKTRKGRKSRRRA